MNYSRRRREVMRQLVKTRAQALFVSNPVNVKYLTGLKSSNAFLLLAPGESTVFTDFRYETAVKELAARQNIKAVILKKSLGKALRDFSRKNGAGRIAYEADHLIVSAFHAIEKATPKIKWIKAKPWISSVRDRKEPEEVAMMRVAIAVAEQGFRSIKQSEWTGLRELEAVDMLEERIRNAARKKGLRATPSFDFIVAAGANAAVPHHDSGNTVIKHGDVLKVDWGARVDGYCSDMTRTIFLGKPTVKFRTIYRTVLKANRAAIRAVRPGVALKTVDAAARKIITDAGYGKAFGHGTGHGIGLEVHEGAGPTAKSKDRVKTDMVFTIEPGIYIPGWGGVRIEDMVVATTKGVEVLTSLPK